MHPVSVVSCGKGIEKCDSVSSECHRGSGSVDAKDLQGEDEQDDESCGIQGFVKSCRNDRQAAGSCFPPPHAEFQVKQPFPNHENGEDVGTSDRILVRGTWSLVSFVMELFQ